MKAMTAVLVAGVALAVSACGTTTSQSAGTTTTSRVVATPASSQATQPGTQPGRTTDAPNSGGSAPTTGDPGPVSTITGDQQPAPGTAVDQQPAPGTPVASTVAAPIGSGHNLCFDLNSELAHNAVARLAATSAGPWQIESASNDPIADGCDGVLSWLTVTSGNIHPYTHVMFFTNGTYLGTATSQPYGYTEVLGKSRTVVSVRYRWAKADDALCCPQGGPSIVTFTLNGTTVQANGQFPPSN